MKTTTEIITITTIIEVTVPAAMPVKYNIYKYYRHSVDRKPYILIYCSILLEYLMSLTLLCLAIR